MPGLECRAERPADAEVIHRIHASAFGREDEAALVRALRAEARPYLGLVAEQDGRVIAHVAFSPVSLESPAPLALGLGPLAVEPARQRSGAGTALTRSGLAACARAGAALVFVLGHPSYYPRFGFRPAAPLRYRDVELDPAFFVLELVPGAASGLSGFVRYHPAFERV